MRIAYERNYMITVNNIIIFFILFTHELVYLKSNIPVKGKYFLRRILIVFVICMCLCMGMYMCTRVASSYSPVELEL